MSDEQTALAELDRLGRRAGAALRAAAQRATVSNHGAAPHGAAPTSPVTPGATAQALPMSPTDPAGVDTTNRANGRGTADRGTGHELPGTTDPVEPVVVELRTVEEPLRRGDRARQQRQQWRRAVLVAAAAVALGGIGAVQVLRTDGGGIAADGSGAPTAVLGDDPGGIYPAGARHRGYLMASPEPTAAWEQWGLEVPAAGRHLVLSLEREGTTVTSVLGNLGAGPLQVATVRASDTVPGTRETAVYGAVDTAATSVVVERPGAAPVPLLIHPLDGTTHNLFAGFLPDELPDGAGEGAEVVALDERGREIARSPLASAEGEPSGSEGSLYPGDPDHATVAASRVGPRDETWDAQALDGGRYLLLSVSGNEDSTSTILEQPGSLGLQVLATRLDGLPGDGEVVAVYGLVDAEAATVELTGTGETDPVRLDLVPLDGATHQAFVGWIPPSVRDDAVVIARDARGEEIGRRHLAWTLFEAAGPG